MRSADRPPVLVWRRGDALLAAEVEAVVEVAGIDGEGTAHSRVGALPLTHLPGLPTGPAARAVVLRAGDALVALPADAMEGIRAIDPRLVSAPPEWLGGLEPRHLRGIVVLDDDRLAALLAADRITP